MKSLLSLLWFLGGIASADAGKDVTALQLKFDELASYEGYILIGIYQSQESWKKRKPEKELWIAKKLILENNMQYTISDLSPGNYALAVLDDPNGNNRVDMGFLFPLEGFGFSNYYLSGFILPDFEDLLFPTLIPTRLQSGSGICARGDFLIGILCCLPIRT